MSTKNQNGSNSANKTDEKKAVETVKEGVKPEVESKKVIPMLPEKTQPKKLSLEELQKALEEQILSINRKKELVSNRELFKEKLSGLQSYLKKIKEESTKEFDTDSFKLVLVESHYREPFLKISNRFIIQKFMEFMIFEITEKIIKLEQLIVEEQ